MRDVNQEFLQSHLQRVLSSFKPDQWPLLEEMIATNVSYPVESKDFDQVLYKRYECCSDLLNQLNELTTPAIGHLVKIKCQNGKVYEQAIITNIEERTLTICCEGGGFLHRLTLNDNGLSMSICGGYSQKIDSKLLVSDEPYLKSYTFSDCEKIKADCGVVIERSMKRWLLDDSSGLLSFY